MGGVLACLSGGEGAEGEKVKKGNVRRHVSPLYSSPFSSNASGQTTKGRERVASKTPATKWEVVDKEEESEKVVDRTEGSACLAAFRELLRGEAKYVIFEFKGTEVCVAKKGATDSTTSDFKKDLPPRRPRYAVLNWHYELDDNSISIDFERNLFILWTPTSCDAKEKIQYISAVDAFREKLEGVSLYVQASDIDDLDDSVLVDRFGRVLSSRSLKNISSCIGVDP